MTVFIARESSAHAWSVCLCESGGARAYLWTTTRRLLILYLIRFFQHLGPWLGPRDSSCSSEVRGVESRLFLRSFAFLYRLFRGAFSRDLSCVWRRDAPLHRTVHSRTAKHAAPMLSGILLPSARAMALGEPEVPSWPSPPPPHSSSFHLTCSPPARARGLRRALPAGPRRRRRRGT